MSDPIREHYVTVPKLEYERLRKIEKAARDHLYMKGYDTWEKLESVLNTGGDDD